MAALSIILGLSTIGFTVLAVLFGRGFIARIAPIIGLLAGTVLAFAMGVAQVGDPMKNGLIAVPQPMPFGMPEFDLLAALPLLIFSIASMAEATGQTSINAEAVGARIDLAKTAPRPFAPTRWSRSPARSSACRSWSRAARTSASSG